MVKQDARFTVKEIADGVGVSSGTVHKILTQELKLRKVCARWVPHLLTKEQKTTSVKMAKYLLKKYKIFDKRRISELFTGDEIWVYYFEPQRRIKQWPQKDQARPIRIKSAAKVLYAVFFNCDGLIVQIPVPNGKTITGKFYKNGMLSKVKAHYEKCRPATGLRGLCLIHANAPAHKFVFVEDFLKEEKGVQLSHPSYSQDLCPCDFFPFPLLKKPLSNRRYES